MATISEQQTGENGHLRAIPHPSPDSLVIRQIISELEEVIGYINDRLKTDFDGPVEIFLYNFDDAKEKIGINSGRYAQING